MWAHYPDWLSNVGLMKKANGKWRMCVHFTNLNKACPKDNFLLSLIDLIVDSTTGYHMLSFMDAYSGYNQISIDPSNEKKISFITYRGLYYYKTMPFGLKNAKATYQRLVNHMFKEHIGWSMEVYVDELLMKSKTHLDDLYEAFAVLKRY